MLDSELLKEVEQGIACCVAAECHSCPYNVPQNCIGHLLVSTHELFNKLRELEKGIPLLDPGKECCANCEHLWETEDFVGEKCFIKVCGAYEKEKTTMALYGDLTNKVCGKFTKKGANNGV